MSLVIAGSGAFGTALAIALSGNGPVTLLGRDAAEMAEIQASRRHEKRLPSAKLPPDVTATADAGVLAQAETVLLCVPMQQLSAFLRAHAGALSGRALVACCKGIDLATLRGPTRIIAELVPTATPAVLSGPSFAADIARERPTALTLACADETRAKALQNALSGSVLRLYRTTDVIGTELGGALKNVIAIAAGATAGADLGDSARAALITRGFAEMQVVARQQGARPETLMGLSGLGDLILTCSSDQSRNFSFGLALGRGDSFDASVTVEGAATARALARIAAEAGLDLPISRAVEALVQGKVNVSEALQALLARPLKEE